MARSRPMSGFGPGAFRRRWAGDLLGVRPSPRTLLVLSVLLAACGEEEKSRSGGDTTAASVCEVVRQPEGFGEVRVEGGGWALPPSLPHLGFVLSANGCSVLVAADRLDAVKAREGIKVEVRGSVQRFGPREAERLLGRTPDTGRDRVAIEGAPPIRVGVGAPFIDSFAATGEDAVEPG